MYTCLSQAHYTTQSSHTEQLEKEVQSLQDTRIHLSQQLADARQKLHNAVSVDTERAEKCEDTLRGTMEELRAAKDRENKVRERDEIFIKYFPPLMLVNAIQD